MSRFGRFISPSDEEDDLEDFDQVEPGDEDDIQEDFGRYIMDEESETPPAKSDFSNLLLRQSKYDLEPAPEPQVSIPLDEPLVASSSPLDLTSVDTFLADVVSPDGNPSLIITGSAPSILEYSYRRPYFSVDTTTVTPTQNYATAKCLYRNEPIVAIGEALPRNVELNRVPDEPIAVRFYDPVSWRSVGQIADAHQSGVRHIVPLSCLSTSEGDNPNVFLATTSGHQNCPASKQFAVRVWDLGGTSGEISLRYELHGHRSWIQDVCEIPTHCRLATTGRNDRRPQFTDKVLRIWDLLRGCAISTSPAKEGIVPHPDTVNRVGWNTERNCLVTFCWDKNIRFFDQDGMQVQEARSFEDGEGTMAFVQHPFNPDQYFVGGWGGSMHLYDVRNTLKVVHKFQSNSNIVRDMFVWGKSENCVVIGSLSYSDLCVWKEQDGEISNMHEFVMQGGEDNMAVAVLPLVPFSAQQVMELTPDESVGTIKKDW